MQRSAYGRLCRGRRSVSNARRPFVLRSTNPSTAPHAPDRERLAYSPQEVADALGICRATVHNMLNRGELRGVKLGGRRLIPAAELARLLNEGADHV